MELRDLRLVVALADELHFGRAAQRLNVGQPALSQQLRRLERRLGTRLFERTTHVVRLTEPGRVFAARARGILTRVDELEAAVLALATTRRLRVGSLLPTYEVCRTVLQALYTGLPGVEVTERHVGGFATARSLLLAGDLDLYVGIPVPDTALVATPLRDDRFGVYVGADHPWAERDAVSLTELDGVPLSVDPDDEVPEYVALVDRMFATVGATLVRSRSGSGSPDAALHAVSWGGPPPVGPAVPAPPGVVWVPFGEASAHAALHVVRRRDDPSDAVAETVAEAVGVLADLTAEQGWQARPVEAR